jgi:hypothetical protein
LESQIPWDERKLLWLELQLRELYRTGDLPDGQSREEESGRRSSGEGATGKPLPEEFGGDFQNHALENTHSPTRARKGWSTRISRLAGRGGFRRLVSKVVQVIQKEALTGRGKRVSEELVAAED